MNKKRIIIVGGLSAGPSAAAKARRTNPDCEIILFEKTGNISTATCGIPYALANETDDSDKLNIVDATLLKDRFDIDVYLHESVIDIDPEAHNIITNKGSKYTYDKLVFATGASAYTPPIDGLETFSHWSHCKSITDLKKIYKEGVFSKAEHITVLGSGLIGIEVAENLKKTGKKVTVIELQKNVLPIWEEKFSIMANGVLKANGIEIKTDSKLEKIDAENRTFYLSDGSSFKSDYLLIAVGLKPNTELLLAEGAEHLKNGALIVNEQMETSLPDIYAAGDCASIKNLITKKHGYFPMGTHSNKGGRVAGANAAGASYTFKGAYNTTIVKIFDYTLARTGFNANMLKSEHIDYESVFFTTTAIPSFYEDPTDLFVEIYFEKNTKKVIGAEIFGEKGVDKRIDVLSTAIYAGLTTHDLENLDLAYAPPYSPAKDAVITAGFIGEREEDENIQTISPAYLNSIIKAGTLNGTALLDIRNRDEVLKSGMITGASNQPLEALLKKADLLNRNEEVIVYCQRGARGYVATLALKARGFTKIKNLAGGFAAWSAMKYSIEIITKPSKNGHSKANKNVKDTNGEILGI